MLLIERGKPQKERIKNVSLTGPVQKKITTMTASNTKNMYMKMFRTAYELAMNPTVSLRQFKTLIKVQRQNGVVLVEGNNLDFSLYQLYCMLSVSLILSSVKICYMKISTIPVKDQQVIQSLLGVFIYISLLCLINVIIVTFSAKPYQVGTLDTLGI